MMQDKKLDLETKNKIEKYVERCREELYESKSVIVLKHMSKKEADYVFDLVKGDEHIVPRSIEYKSCPAIFFKYQIQSENIDLKELFQKAKTEYNIGHLKGSLQAYKKILQVISRPKSFVFYRIGLLYLKHHQQKQALLYLNIALGLSKKENFEHSKELEELISNINHNVPIEEQKNTKYINISEDEFLPKYENSKIEDIAALIKTDNLNLEDTCKQYNLTGEETLLVSLVCARNSYASKNFTAGDKLLKRVERTKDKTPVVKSLLKEITTNKKMYQYRQDTKTKIKKEN